IKNTIHVIAATAGIEVEGSISEWSIGQIMLEGEVAATAQLVDEISKAKDKLLGITLSSDGTTHKNTNYQSHHITYSLPGEDAGVTRFVSVSHEINHMNETQLVGWQELITGICSLAVSTVSSGAPADSRTSTSSSDNMEFVEKVKGMLTDHVEDQKKLVCLFLEWKKTCEWKVQGECALTTLTSAMLEGMLREVGGLDQWGALLEAEQSHCLLATCCVVYHKIGLERFNVLPQSEKDATNFFIWGGCIHKDLNAVKEGNVAMTAWWQANGIDSPILLMNQDNAIVAPLG
ncbi:hypothetical protein BS17DRAFT_662774, partial [Gyrodon lividus]